MISCINIHKSYGQLHVLKGINLTVEPGEIVCITGESGAGKSTLLHILGTLDRPDDGEVFFKETPVHSMKNARLSEFRNRNMGFVFQFHQLLPEFTALENVCIPAWIGRESKKAAMNRGKDLLGYLGLGDRWNHRPSQLSGGEQQRVAVARALINEPGVVFADEPSGNLDSKNATLLHEYFLKLKADMGQTFVIVTHNPELAIMGDRHVKMKDGAITGE